ncbi:IclR family transcriptional regulator [Melghirimyces profundicolus]|uniref:IclR family transcriptional regulator n=1 Tax=Melghirimyces profundicolus TaxID=1242148 RepID=UPI0011B26D70|nr:IclR family transcriptional regulator [Melghirimyces profundicolus]
MNGKSSEMKPAYGTAVLKAAAILQCLSGSDSPLGVSEISRKTGIGKSTVHKLLQTLIHVGYVEKTQRDARFRLGIGLIKMAHNSLSRMDIVQVSAPFLETLNEETGETVHLGVPDGHQVVYVNKLESRRAVRMYSRVGLTAPLYCTGLGKAILSCFSPEEFSRYLEETKLRSYTQNTLSSPSALTREMETIRKRGYVIDDGEHEEEVRCIAVPLEKGSRIFGAVSVSAPRYRMDDGVLLKYLPPLKICQKNILERL